MDYNSYFKSINTISSKDFIVVQTKTNIGMLMGEKKTFTCKNSSCKRTFTIPLKTLNLQGNPNEPYYSCPFCLTKIEVEEVALSQDNLPEEKNQNGQKLENLERDKATKNDEKPLACKYYLGYLSERGQKDKIPDDCLLCKNIVDCMLKRMREDK